MAASVKYVLSPFEGNTNYGDPTGFKLKLQSTKDIYREYDKLYISVSNAKDIIDHFLSLANKYDWGRLTFMIQTGEGANNIFMFVEHIQLAYIHHQAHWIFWINRNWKYWKCPFEPFGKTRSDKFIHQCTVSTKFL